MHYSSFDLFDVSGEFGTSDPMGVTHGTQKCRQKLTESEHSFDQIHLCAPPPPPNHGNFQILNCPMKPKGVTTQMKALDVYILMVLFVLLLKRVHNLTNET